LSFWNFLGPSEEQRKTTKECVTLYVRKIAAYLALEDLPGREAEHSHLSSAELEEVALYHHFFIPLHAVGFS
jgi:hypothetical protein